jgi:hypothetical protein
MSLSGRANDAIKHLALSAALGIVVLTVILTGLGFLAAALYITISQRFPPGQAAAMTGAALLAGAILIGAIGGVTLRKLKKPQPSMIAEFAGTFGLATRVIGMLVRRDPKKAVILAALSGAIAEYVMGDRK